MPKTAENTMRGALDLLSEALDHLPASSLTHRIEDFIANDADSAADNHEAHDSPENRHPHCPLCKAEE